MSLSLILPALILRLHCLPCLSLMATAYDHNMKSWWVFVIFLLLGNLGVGVDGETLQQLVPCYFIFGDSLSDSGNNNLLATLAKANFKPYGIDFPQGPTGRFTNGRTLVDITAELLGFKGFIPSFVSAKGEDVLQGVNYASGGAGIRDESGQNLGDRFTMNEQLRNYKLTVTQIATLLGGEVAAADHLSKCIFTVGIGSNDYSDNYFLPSLYPTSRQYTPEQYAVALIAEYSSQLKTLHRLGARKVALFGLGLIGCAPGALAAYGPSPGSTCVDYINSAVQLFNEGLKSLVDDLNTQFTDAKFTYIDYYGIGLRDITTDAGFKVMDSGCCGGQTGCEPLATPCPNRKEYVFWDEFHPSEAANVIVAGRAYNSATPSDACPIDISTLAKL